MDVSVVPHHNRFIVFVSNPSKSLHKLLSKYIDVILSKKQLTKHSMKIVIIKNKRSEEFLEKLKDISNTFEISRILPN